jgi:hypothetical protein
VHGAEGDQGLGCVLSSAEAASKRLQPALHLLLACLTCTCNDAAEWIVHLRMTDDSLPPGAPSVDLLLFGERHHLPSVREVGDIVRLHRVKVRDRAALQQSAHA